MPPLRFVRHKEAIGNKHMNTQKRVPSLSFVLCCISFWSTAVIANANEEKASNVIKLWPKDAAIQDGKGMGTPKPDRGDGHIRLTDVTTPSLRYFPAPATKEPVPAVILCPGGGYVHLVTTKMTPIAEWLNEHGISAFILIYRTPKKRNDAFEDMQRAVRIVRSRASEWNIEPRRIGVMGSSAGGHLAARVSTGFDIQTYQEVDKHDRVSWEEPKRVSPRIHDYLVNTT
jgi:acetyl esterase/lipase